MNRQIRRVAIAVGVLMVALFVNLNFVQVVKGDDYRDDAANRRVLLNEYSTPRGQIVVQGTAVAESVKTTDELKYLAPIPSGPAYAPVTGFYSLVYGKSRLEEAEDAVLSATTHGCSGRRIADILTGREPKGGSVELTLEQGGPAGRVQGAGATAAAPSWRSIRRPAPSWPRSAHRPTTRTRSARTTPRRSSSRGTTPPQRPEPADAQPRVQPELPARIDLQGRRGRRCAQGRQAKPTDRIPAPDVLPLPGTATATMQELRRRAVRRRQDRHSRPRLHDLLQHGLRPTRHRPR